jgi:hypothetical protein
MIMIDDKQAALIGMADVLSKEIAFAIDRYCYETATNHSREYNDVYDALLREVEKLQVSRQRGKIHNHPHEDIEEREEVVSKDSFDTGSPDIKTPAELALEQALKDIEKIKAKKAKAEKKAEKARKKAKNKKKKGNKDA